MRRLLVTRRNLGPAAARTPNLQYWGGRVLQKPALSMVYLGDYWSSGAGSADRTYVDSFAQSFGQTSLAQMLGEYSCGAPTFARSTTTTGNPAQVTDAMVQQIVAQQPTSNPETIHTVMLPPGAVLNDGQGMTSRQGMGGYHGSFVDRAGQTRYYAVIAYSDQRGNGIDFDGSSRDALTITLSHEWFEAITDPDVATNQLGWYDKVNNAEIGDLAIDLLPLEKTYARVTGGFAVQLEWSQRDRRFEAASSSAAPSSVVASRPASGGSVSGAQQTVARLGLRAGLRAPPPAAQLGGPGDIARAWGFRTTNLGDDVNTAFRAASRGGALLAVGDRAAYPPRYGPVPPGVVCIAVLGTNAAGLFCVQGPNQAVPHWMGPGELARFIGAAPDGRLIQLD